MIAHFNQFFIHTGKFKKDLYYLITSSYKIREKSDYDDFYLASKDDAYQQLKSAEKFFAESKKFLKKEFSDIHLEK